MRRVSSFGLLQLTLLIVVLVLIGLVVRNLRHGQPVPIVEARMRADWQAQQQLDPEDHHGCR